MAIFPIICSVISPFIQPAIKILFLFDRQLLLGDSIYLNNSLTRRDASPDYTEYKVNLLIMRVK